MLKSGKVNIIIGDIVMNAEKINNTFNSLKEKREALGLTLKDVFQRTRITAVNLEAIENGDLHLLPVPIYTRSFIKTYARTLGVDSNPLLESYEEYLSSLQIVEAPSPENLTENISFLDKIVQYKTYLWTAAALIFIIIVSLLISSQHKSATDINSNPPGKMAAIDTGEKADTLSPPTKETVTVDEQAKAIPQPASNETNKIKQIPAQSNAIRQENIATQPRASNVQNTRALASSEEASLLIIEATEETWIRIKADQNPSYQIILKPGEKIKRKAARFNMDVGNAGGIKIQFNGKNIENTGKSGEVIHLQLP
jgi:cytoskeleton protein RodZ